MDSVSSEVVAIKVIEICLLRSLCATYLPFVLCLYSECIIYTVGDESEGANSGSRTERARDTSSYSERTRARLPRCASSGRRRLRLEWIQMFGIRKPAFQLKVTI